MTAQNVISAAQLSDDFGSRPARAVRAAVILFACTLTACAPTGPCFAPRNANTQVQPSDGELVDRVWIVPGDVQDDVWRGMFLLTAEPAAERAAEVQYAVLARSASESADEARTLTNDASTTVTLTCAAERPSLARGAWEVELPDADLTGETVYQINFGPPRAVLLRSAPQRSVDPYGTLEFIPAVAIDEP